MNRFFRGVRRIVLIVLALMICQSIPMFLLKNWGMSKVEGQYVKVYYDLGDEKGGKEVLRYVENRMEGLREKLNFKKDKKTSIYVYKYKKSFYIRKYGFISPILVKALGAEWYVGDNKGDKALLVSPYVNDMDLSNKNIFKVAIHETVHTINYRKNKNLSYFLDNGVAMYLAEQGIDRKIYRNLKKPNMAFMHINDEVEFGNNSGYQLAYSYVDFLNSVYGWGSVLGLVEGRSYEDTFKKSEKEIYDEWIKYLDEEVEEVEGE